MSEIGKNFDLVDFLSQFQPMSANISLKTYWIMSSIFLERFQHSDSKTFQKGHTRCIKT